MKVYISFSENSNVQFSEQTFYDVQRIDYEPKLNSVFLVFYNRPCERIVLKDVTHLDVI